MKRVFGLIVIILVSGACGAGSWLTFRPPVAAFLAPGARDIQVVTVSNWEQQINYHVAGPPFAWYWGVAHALEEQKWTLQTSLRPDLAGYPITPLRFEWLSIGFVVDEVTLDPDQRNPNVARIHVSRRISIPWRQFPWRF